MNNVYMLMLIIWLLCNMKIRHDTLHNLELFTVILLASKKFMVMSSERLKLSKGEYMLCDQYDDFLGMHYANFSSKTEGY